MSLKRSLEGLETTLPKKVQRQSSQKNVHDAINKKLRGLDAYEKIDKLGEGTYGIVYMARDRRNNNYVALKRVREQSNDNNNNKYGFPITSIREIKILQNLNHPNIVKLIEIVRSNIRGYIFLVFEYYEHDLSYIINNMKKTFQICEIKCIMLQLLNAIEYSHKLFVIHRDIKLSNILYNNKGKIVLADWGLARLYSHPLKIHTSNVVTLWYRAPELLFGCQKYHTAIDIWAIGCIFAELLKNKPLLPGKNEIEQVQLIYKLLGTPNNNIYPGWKRLPNIKKNIYKNIDQKKYKYNEIDQKFNIFGHLCLDLIKKFLAYDPAKRITAKNAIKHSYFKQIPLPLTQQLMPTFKSKHEKNK